MAALFPADHFLIMTLYALLVSVFFSVLWANERRARLRLFAKSAAALNLQRRAKRIGQ